MRPIMNYDRATTQYNNKHDNVSSGHVHPSAAASSPSNMVVIYYEQEYYRLASDELLSFFYNLLRDCLATTIITSTTSSETSPLSTSITEIRSSFISKQREDDRTYFCSLVADAQRRNRELEAKVNELGYQCCELMSRNKEYEEIHREQIILYNDNVWLKSEISRLKSLVEQQSEQLYERDCLLMTLDTELSEVKESNKQLFEAQKAEYRLRFETEHSLSEKVSFLERELNKITTERNIAEEEKALLEHRVRYYIESCPHQLHQRWTNKICFFGFVNFVCVVGK